MAVKCMDTIARVEMTLLKQRNNDRLPSTTVEKKPNITAVLADPSFKVNQGQNVEVQCAVTGIPSPQHGEIILKRKNQIEIAPTETKMTETVTTSFFELTMGSYPGPFWCVATTSAGFAQKEFNFTIPVLPTPSNPPELVIKGATFLKLKLNSHPFIGDGPIKKTILLMKQSGQGRSFNTYERNIVNDTAEVRDLLPYTDYTFRVLLYREGGFSGRGHPGPTAVIKTDCGYPSSGPSIKNIHSKNNSILYLSWRLPPPSEIKGEVLGYKIYYRALGETSPSWTKVIFAYSSTTSATLKNMKPLAVYSVKIRLYNCAGDSPDSKEVRVTMGRLKKPDGPNVNLVNQTSRCLGFTWKPPTNAKPYTISGYEVLFEETTNPSADRLNILQNVSGMVFTRNSLTPYTTYKFRVRAYNHEGPGNFSDEMNVTTNEEAPGQPSNFHVESRTPFQIELSWDVPLQPNGIITQYIINSSRDGEIWKQKTTPGDERSVSILGLAEYTKYLFQIQAVTIEPGAWSVVLEARTMSLGPLEPPQSIDVNSPSPQSVSLSWLPPPASIYVHEVKQYKIIYTDDLRQRMEHWKERLVDGTKRNEEIMNLRSDTVYLFAMAAVTQRPGPFSERKTIRTRRLGVPPPPKNVYLTNVTSNSAIIHWKVENGYSITNVRIRIKSGNTLEWQDLLYLASSERAMLEQLDSGTRYSIELTAGNHNGESSGNPIKNFQTLEASVIGEGIILQVLVPVLVAVVAILFGIIVYCKCRGRSDSDSMSTAPLEMDSISNHMRVSTIGSSFLSGATINSRSGTLLSSHSVHSGNSRAPSTHSGQLLLAESLIICWENILFEDIALGEGNFGQVVKAVVQREDKLIQVAVKMLKDGCSVDDRKDFLAELDMMARLGNHKNIISLVGACENDSSLYLCTEYAPNGNLLQFLRKSRHSGIDGTYTTLTQNQLLQFALDVCEGMAYLSDKQLIHRDLAARNVLLSGNLTCKVADFGLSRGEGVYVKKTVARLPIRWMAIESLNYNVYTTKSDVWSFGVLLWEIVSLGGTPYYGMSCAELYEKLPQGYRMEQPLNCDSEVYKLMSQCWKNRPYDRPSFSQLCVALRRMIDARSSRNYVNTSVFENFMFATIDANEEEG
uniref:angiopoietin-1 receptor-like isoform X1 n=2 Tax=Styela clava TaxID=7725 RepID=UPI00193AA4AC|nr:angiopoietin-1 receptor-like isoform X1 [Styela clava]